MENNDQGSDQENIVLNSCPPFSMSFKEQLLAGNLLARGHEIIIIKLISLFP